jgi:hypothetical protein
MVVLFFGTGHASATELSGYPDSSTMNTPGPYEGVFSGSVSGDNRSQAPITLKLTHRSDDIEGVVSIGEGLYVNAGRWVEEYSIHGRFSVKTQPGKPNQLTTQLTFNVSNFQIDINLEGLISEDGNIMTLNANIDLPWICGRDPALTGILYRNE